MAEEGTFCTVFDCMDGRCQQLIVEWCKRKLGAEYPDTITIAGCDGVLATNAQERKRALDMARISVGKHGAETAVIIGHSECAGYPVGEAEHRDAIKKDAALIAESGIFKSVIGLFVDLRKGVVIEVCRTEHH
jgi:hypothetical protein